MNDDSGIRFEIYREKDASHLYIFHTVEDDTGSYRCIGTTKNGSDFEAKSKVIVAGNS